mmetsp:Transcript_23110/g.33818  ORF Transcript_23110/g.33818 Transcript_23110/m.33818 type:complete len:196 (+) Transcript_23110:118-705(+)|eukprot:CAMPEP_0197248010 /NCGR_PEP_ID=MMETSP1429-20130617/32617_1 /TAXON_ID=49237 /ORGANISM="Chaetoceros  sp., Strain UNC1202" /LENGTH=195 /DNA_ID=CAMNT_0042709075 /DNA_START=117 /DNA_END=704 /DNA_ORIENTATION=-
MFLPSNLKSQADDEAAEAERKKAYDRIEKWCLDIIPEDIRNQVQMSVQEIVCGDVDCSPIDTAIAILFDSGGRGMLGLPMEAKDVTKQVLLELFPYDDVLVKWANGQDADWPPLDDDLDDMEAQLPALRFNVGQKVECRIGPDEVTGWAPGTITQLWYREQDWAEGSFAPYKVTLDTGMDIFAPGDVEMVIRARK